MEAVWLVLLIGVFIGFYLGRWRAENGRARADQTRTWDTRTAYRNRPK